MAGNDSKTGCVVIGIALAAGAGVFAWMAMDSAAPPPEPVEEATPSPVLQAAAEDTDDYNAILQAAARRDAAGARGDAGGAATSHASSSGTTSRTLPVFTGWREGPRAYRQAMDARDTARGPMALLFYVDWCGYCRHMNDELLAAGEARDYFGDITAVRINPDDGDEEKGIAEEWGVRGYPSFFILPEGSTRGSKVHPYKRSGDERTAMSPEAFVQSCRNLGGG